ncbi:MAG: DUF4281 domain-containing protein [Halioglobus sp.]|nr:DUF4281 domain-containing protein [Halioglobus sp.]
MDASTNILDHWFSIAGQAVTVGWIILIIGPRSNAWLLCIPRFAIPFAISLLYAGYAMAYFFADENGGFGSLDAVAALFSQREMLLAGWVHYLAFDLFIGGWIAVESDRLGLSRLAQAPILFTTFFLGPVGLATFLVIKATVHICCMRAFNRQRTIGLGDAS